MSDIKLDSSGVRRKWSETQLHWNDKQVIQSQRVPRTLVLNWRKMTQTLRSLCIEKAKNKGDKIVLVDIGCGAGKFCDHIMNVVKSYIGIDPSDSMLSQAIKGDSKLFIRAVGEEVPLKDGVADIVLLKSVIDQSYDPKQVIAESHRILKGQGWILISLSNRSAYYAVIRDLYTLLKHGNPGHFFKDSHLYYFNMEDVTKMLKDNFHILRRISFGYLIFPHFFDRFLSDSTLYRLIQIADNLGSNILPQNGGGFILLGEKI